MKRLYRSNDNKVFGGILGGLGEYFDVDPVLKNKLVNGLDDIGLTLQYAGDIAAYEARH